MAVVDMAAAVEAAAVVVVDTEAVVVEVVVDMVVAVEAAAVVAVEVAAVAVDTIEIINIISYIV